MEQEIINALNKNSYYMKVGDRLVKVVSVEVAIEDIKDIFRALSEK